MPRAFPDLRVHDDRAVETDHLKLAAVGAERRVANHNQPPGVLEIALQLDTERAVVPEAVDPAVDFAALKNEPPPLAQGDDALHGVTGQMGHVDKFLTNKGFQPPR